MTFESDFSDLMRRVELGELGSSNLVEMVLIEREKNAVLVDALREYQVLYNDLKSVWLRAGVTRDDLGTFLDDERAIADLVELILWLAIPWADNDPIFPESDGWTPRALEANVRMKETWQRVVRGRTPQESPGAVPEESKGGSDDPNEASK